MHIIRVEALHNSLYYIIMCQTPCCKQDVLSQDVHPISAFCMYGERRNILKMSKAFHWLTSGVKHLLIFAFIFTWSLIKTIEF